MITVTVYGEPHECSKAVKGNDFVTLYDEEGNVAASFNGISSFDGYEMSGGEWSAPESETSIEEYLIDLDYRMSMIELGL